jgi:imidazolonepropionase
MTKADLLIHSAAQLCVIPPHNGGPQRGHRLGDLGLIEDGAVACVDGRIATVGTTEKLCPDWWSPVEIDASDRVVCPGFVDPHTHAVWAGHRADEFVLRLKGATYQEIMARGGGIMSTVRATRDASLAQLVAETRPRLNLMLAHGTTTAEVKTGYGLSVADELKSLEAIAALDLSHPITLIPTFMGAHAVPAEYKDDADSYIRLVVEEMLPATKECFPDTPFCDVFCDQGAFTLEQSREVLEAAHYLGFELKIHADEFKPLGGTALAVELGAISADHLVCTPPEEIERLGQSNTVAVSLPATPFGLADRRYTPAQAFLDANGILALASDCNPGTAWNESMPFVIALACRYLGITPAQALVAATLNAAYAVRLGHAVGSLQPGYAADIVILNVPNVHHLGYRFGTNLVGQIVKGGDLIQDLGRATW